MRLWKKSLQNICVYFKRILTPCKVLVSNYIILALYLLLIPITTLVDFLYDIISRIVYADYVVNVLKSCLIV